MTAFPDPASVEASAEIINLARADPTGADATVVVSVMLGYLAMRAPTLKPDAIEKVLAAIDLGLLDPDLGLD